jgi:hypothetical protein
VRQAAFRPSIRHAIRAGRGPLAALVCAWLVLSGVGARARADQSDAAAPTFEDIVAPSTRSHDRSVALMEAWVRAHPADTRVARGLIWMAQLRVADQQPALGRAYFQRAYHEYPSTEWGLHGLKGLADLDLAERRYGDAIARYEALAASRDPFFRYVGRMAANKARGERLRVVLALGALAALGALWALRLLRLGSWRRLWPPPTEVAYLLPLLLLMAAAASGQPAEEARAVRLLTLGALVTLWLGGAYLRARPPAGGWRFLHGLLGVLQAAALLYVAVQGSGLWDKFHDTLVMGAE